MKILNQSLELKKFFKTVSKAANRVLIVDYDGTMAPVRVERDKAIPYPGVIETLESTLRDDNCRLVLITGRGINDLIPLIGLEPLPEIWGCHGWERMMPDGTYSSPGIKSPAASDLGEAHTYAKKMGLAHLCERKTACLAIHWRGLEPKTIEEIKSKVEKKWKSIADGKKLTLHEFNGGIELRPQGRDKGYAVNAIIEQSDGGTAAAYLGDDFTDEDAFRAIHGKGLSVLVNPELRPTRADLWLIPPEELVAFLHRWNAACRGEI